MIRPVAFVFAAALSVASFQTSPPPPPIRGLTSAAAVARAYDTILDADFAALPARIADACGAAPPEACLMVTALGQWWQIALEPESRLRDVTFERQVAEAIDAAAAWTVREPQRAEAWFYLGAAYGTRVQWRVLREERLAAARDGKRIKESLERALALDPAMYDAAYGLGLYRYYADVAPSALKFLRWLLLLPAGNRAGGLRQIVDAREHGELVRGEADYQLHLIYLWYEHRAGDAIAIVRDLQRRYPGNPLFWQIEAEIEDVYFHDHAASQAAAARLLGLAESGRVHEASLAAVRARLQMAIELDHLGDRHRAIAILETIVSTHPPRPYDAVRRAQSLQKIISARKEPRPRP